MNSPSVLSFIGKRTREGCDRGSEVGTVHNGQDGKGQFLRGNRRNLAGEGVVRNISSPKRVSGVHPNFCNGRCQWAGNMGRGECCSGLASESANLFPRSAA